MGSGKESLLELLDHAVQFLLFGVFTIFTQRTSLVLLKELVRTKIRKLINTFNTQELKLTLM